MYAKHKKIILLVAGLAVVVIISLIVFISMPKSISGKIEDKVTFSGYNHDGIATLNDYSDILSSSQKNQAYPVTVTLSKYDKLKNGEKISIIVSADKKSGIKSESKKITVKGLKKTTSYSIDDLIKKQPIAFKGFDGSGEVNYDDEDGNSIFTFSEATNLSNGDKIKVTVDSQYIEEQLANGRVISGSDSKEVTVSKLQTLDDISNIDEVSSLIQSYANAENKTDDYDTYTLTAGKSYVFATPSSYSMFSNNTNNSSNTVTIVRVFRIERTKGTSEYSSEDTKIKYKIYGYKNIPLKDSKLSISDLDSDDKYYEYSSYDSEEAAIDALKADYPGMKEVTMK